MQRALLETLAQTRGVRYVAMVKLSGELTEHVSLLEDEQEQEQEKEALKRFFVQGIAALNQIESSLEAKKWNDLLLDLEDGPALFTPVGTELLVVGFDEVASLGRIRFAVKRAIASQ